LFYWNEFCALFYGADAKTKQSSRFIHRGRIKWIGMKGVTANSVSRGRGRKSHSLDGMPPAWRAFMAEHEPEAYADIEGAINNG
jgi:hypothetical protein